MSGQRRLAAVSVALALVLLLAAPAAARKFQMSGTWIYRSGINFLPLQFATPGPDRSVWVSMGDLTNAFGFPNGPIAGHGGVAATGSAPATLQLPAHRFVEDAMALVLGNGITIVQVTTNIGIDAPYAAATVAPGGGPGSFTWCPGDPACVAGGGMLSTDPPVGAGTLPGRVIYRAGANRFGGAMQLGLRRGGDIAALFDDSPFRVWHVPFAGSDTALRHSAVGGLGSADAPTTQLFFLKRAFVTQPTMAPPPGSPILYPGPKVTTMLGTTLAGSGLVFYFPQIGTGPMGTPAGEYRTQHGFANTTGTVLVQQIDGSSGSNFFTAMGSDGRTPLGAGNLSLVAGGLAFTHTYAGLSYSASFQKVKLTLGAPIPSLSPAGLAAATALVLLAAGWALRRRFG